MTDLESRLHQVNSEILKIINRYPLDATPKELWEARRDILESLYKRSDYLLQELGI